MLSSVPELGYLSLFLLRQFYRNMTIVGYMRRSLTDDLRP
jgi:hypothetical protein